MSIYIDNIRLSADRLSATPIIGGDFQTPEIKIWENWKIEIVV